MEIIILILLLRPECEGEWKRPDAFKEFLEVDAVGYGNTLHGIERHTGLRRHD